MEELINPIHTLIWFISFIGIVISIAAIYFNKGRWGYILAPFTYLVNVFLYNTVLHATIVYNIGNVTFQQLEIWSAVVRLHAMLLAILYIIFRISARGK